MGSLGPGSRAVLWVQGCRKNCPGCISPELKENITKTLIDPATLAAQIMALDQITGVTVSGGEPLDQAASLTILLREIKSKSPLNTMVYTGYSLAQISQPESLACLEWIDLLVDGPFIQSLPHALWRGSANQQFYSPSGYFDQATLDHWSQENRSPLEFRFLGDTLQTIGIPSRNFMAEFEKRLREKGIDVGR
jgi:anaerobic ribonucleoside-triphosphate reductase activating protein